VAAAVVKGRQLLASAAGDATVRIWDLEAGDAVATFAGHGGEVNTVTFGRLGEADVVVTGDDDGAVRAWSLATREQIGHCMTTHASWISAVRCSVDGLNLLCAVGSNDGLVRVWDVSDRRLLAEIAMATVVRDLAITTDRRLLVGTSSGLAVFHVRR
jgi:WD40 repeat protein